MRTSTSPPVVKMLRRAYISAMATEGDVFGSGGDRMRALAVGDIDSDGGPDIVAGNDCQASAVFFNPLRQPRR